MKEKTVSSMPSFGTGGIRGIMGQGKDHINAAVIRCAAAAFAKHIQAPNTVYIGYDTRHNSSFYAEEAARTLNTFGITTILSPYAVPVPLVSFVTRREKIHGIMITASHNTKEYNGFKVYNNSGGQILPKEAAAIEQYFSENDIPILSKKDAMKKGLFRYGGKAEETAYLTAITRKRSSLPLTVIATPLHGSGYQLLPRAIKKRGHRVIIPKEQASPNGDFPTVTAPNPEDPAVFALSETLGNQYAADLLLAVDGDGDRCGCCVRHRGSYHYLIGNNIAAILLYYLTRERYPSLPKDGYIACSDVSGGLGTAIAKEAGLEVRTVPTGFKFIGELIRQGKGTFFAGYEESGGFLRGDLTADKDGIGCALLLCDAASCYKEQHRTLIDVLEEIRNRYGREYTVTRKYPLSNGIPDLAGVTIPGFHKEIKGTTVIFSSDRGIKVALRPSGTEPYIKSYLIFNADDDPTAADIEKEIEKVLTLFLNPQKEEC